MPGRCPKLRRSSSLSVLSGLCGGALLSWSHHVDVSFLDIGILDMTDKWVGRVGTRDKRYRKYHIFRTMYRSLTRLPQLSHRIAWFYAGSSLANAFGGLIGAGVLGNLDGSHGIAGWRWLFIIEGVITLVMAVASG